MKVFVSASAGNVGAAGSVVNAAPWVLTVAAILRLLAFCSPDITAPGVNILAAYPPQNGENADAIFL
ncbi:hypothetical protein SO802_030780 [Lithocarpus litseifolius]|uniref:Uncharacterized protein n=1 Tax=Lithocarpus litseifolius TaxID=425828 RepID=A0AAW2BLM3_9ROSI